MNPEPLIGGASDGSFKAGVDCCRILHVVTSHLDNRFESEYVAPLLVGPDRITRYHGRSGPIRNPGKGRPDAGPDPEERNEHTFVEPDVLIDEYADHFVARQRPKDRSRRVLLLNNVIA